jgi:hypothetical protein
VIATVNGHKIIKKEADRYLSERTQGKIKNFDLLPKKQQLALVKELSLPLLLVQNAQKNLSDMEQEAVLSNAWMQKSVKEMDIPESEIKTAYEKVKAQANVRNPLQQIPPYESLKNRIRMQIGEQKIVERLMQGAQIRVEPSSDTIAGYVGMLAITIDDVNKALQVMTKGKMTWDTIPERDKKRVLQMVAPNKLIALSAENGLSKKEKENALSNYWMQKRISTIDVTENEIKKRYNKIKKLAKKSKKKSVPEYAALEKSLKVQIAQEKLVESLTKKAKIKLK